MNKHRPASRAVIAALALLFLVPFASAQYREYYFVGKVVDTGNQPLPGVEIQLRDVDTSRGYTVKSDKKGEYKFAGLPHGVYRVIFKKEGFAAKEDEWRFVEPQDTMQKIEIPPIVLVSEDLVKKQEMMKINEAEIQAAADEIRSKDYDGAITRLTAFLEKNPGDSNALYFLGICLARKHQYADAAEKFAKVSELVPEFPPVYFELGLCYEKLGESEKAVAAYGKNLELDPGNVDSAYNSGLILFGLGRVQEAQVQFEKALALKPADPDILEMAGRCYINAGDIPRAIEVLEKAKAASTNEEKIKFLDDMISALKKK